MQKFKKRVGVLAGFGLMAAVVPAETSKAITLYSTGFEPAATTAYPTDAYVPNFTLAGQGSWTGTTGGTTPPVAGIYTYSTYFSSTPNPSNLQFAGLVDQGLGSGAVAYYSPTVSYTPNATVGKVLDIVFQMDVAVAATGDPFFGVIARQAGTPIAGVGIDGTTGHVEFISGSPTGNTIFQGNTSANPGIGPSDFYSYELQLNYGTSTFNVYAAPIGATSFTPGELIDTGAMSATGFSDASLSSYGLSGTGASGVALFDNFTISAVPEPTTMSIVLGGAALATLSRRRSKRVSA